MDNSNGLMLPRFLLVSKMQIYNSDQTKHLSYHSGPKMPKSEPRGEGPKFIVHLKEGHIVILKHKVFFQSVERIF